MLVSLVSHKFVWGCSFPLIQDSVSGIPTLRSLLLLYSIEEWCVASNSNNKKAKPFVSSSLIPQKLKPLHSPEAITPHYRCLSRYLCSPTPTPHEQINTGLGEKAERELRKQLRLRAPMDASLMADVLILGQREDQIIAAKEIGKLNCKQKRKLVERGVVSHLVFMLLAEDCECVEAALFALLNLAFGSERNKICIAKSGAVPAILKILNLGNESLLELALANLLILSSCSANKPGMVSSGAVQLLFQLLDSQLPTGRTIGISHQARLDIIYTLQNLSTSPQIIPSIVFSGGLIVLMQLIYEYDKSSDMVEKVTALLESIVSSSDIALKEISEIGGTIPVLVEAVEEGTKPCKEHAAGILALICKSCKEIYRGMILREGAIPGLLQLSVDGTTGAREKARSLLLLLRDCSSGRSSSVQYSKNVMLEEVMRKIECGGEAGSSIQIEEMIARLRT